MSDDKVVATAAALELLAEIRGDHGDVVFQMSAGCCDGSGPMCYRKADLYIGANDVKLGEIDGAEVWASNSIAGIWANSQLIFDVGEGSGNGFSLDTGRPRSFITKSKLLDKVD